jgi:hypothetical protein
MASRPSDASPTTESCGRLWSVFARALTAAWSSTMTIRACRRRHDHPARGCRPIAPGLGSPGKAIRSSAACVARTAGPGARPGAVNIDVAAKQGQPIADAESVPTGLSPFDRLSSLDGSKPTRCRSR